MKGPRSLGIGLGIGIGIGTGTGIGIGSQCLHREPVSASYSIPPTPNSTTAVEAVGR